MKDNEAERILRERHAKSKDAEEKYLYSMIANGLHKKDFDKRVVQNVNKLEK